MRSAWREMIVEKLRGLVGRGRAVEQGFDVAANRRQRRAQLVRDVGDEVAPNLIGVAQRR